MRSHPRLVSIVMLMGILLCLAMLPLLAASRVSHSGDSHGRAIQDHKVRRATKGKKHNCECGDICSKVAKPQRCQLHDCVGDKE
jgi:hypothetical protein